MTSQKPARQVTIDPNIGLPSLEPHPDEPSGCWYSFRKSIRGLWATRETEDTATNRDLYIRTSLRELFVYLLFLSTTLVITFGSMRPGGGYHLVNAMKHIFVQTEPSFEDITTMAAAKNYLAGPLLQGLFWQGTYTNDFADSKHHVYYTNKLLGLARLRQVRVRNGSCTIPPQFKSFIHSCHGFYSDETEENIPFGLKTFPAWQYQNATSKFISKVFGKATTYNGGGYIQELTRNKTESAELIENLLKNRWIDRATRAIVVDFAIFNPNLNLFVTIQLLIEFLATGGVVSSHDIRVSKFFRRLTNMDYIVFTFELIFCGFVFYYMGEETIEISKLKLRYFTSLWNLLDVVVITISLGCIGFTAYWDLVVEKQLPDLLLQVDKFVDYQYFTFFQVNLNNARAVTLFVSWLKLFKYLKFNKSMMQLADTIGGAAKDLGSFSIMFFLVFYAFAQLGYFLFGTQLKEFSDMPNACFTLLKVLLCEFEFEGYRSANRVLGPIFFFLYAFVVYFILLNMFLAIINDAYSNMKNDLRRKQNEFEIADFIRRAFDKLMRNLHIKKLERQKDSRKSAVQQMINRQKAEKELVQWQEDLKSRGYTEDEINAVFGGNIPTAENGEDDEEQGGGDGPNSAEVTELREKVARMEGALTKLLANFQTTLTKIEIIDKAKQYRSRKLDVIIDKLDGGDHVKNKRKSELTRSELDRHSRELDKSSMELYNRSIEFEKRRSEFRRSAELARKSTLSERSSSHN